MVSTPRKRSEKRKRQKNYPKISKEAREALRKLEEEAKKKLES